ncbi:MAG: hypothetical protein J7M18_03485 [Candidatus Eremiobacteraeota bacterium]|nr:hypothetical protein [Candidatus Eremiobacteraeota bacterium]
MAVILITGEIGTGKSTLIQRVLGILSPDEVVGLFTTKRPGSRNFEVVISGFHKNEEMLIGRHESGRGMIPVPTGFFHLGVRLLDNVKGSSFLVIDELGFLENSAPCFRYYVFKAIDRVKNGILVLRDVRTPFLEAIRKTPGTRLFNITRENRNEILNEVLEVINAGK